MAWVNPSTVTAGQVLNATKWNQDVIANTEFLARPPGVGLTRTTEQSVASGVWRSVAWNTEGWDYDSMWSSTAATRIESNTAGKYEIKAYVPWSTGSTGLRLLGLYAGAVGSSTQTPNQMRITHVMPAGSAGEGVSMTLTATLALTSTSVVRIQALQNTGGALNINHDPSGGTIPRCVVQWVSS